jgi:hypothetical protein
MFISNRRIFPLSDFSSKAVIWRLVWDKMGYNLHPLWSRGKTPIYSSLNRSNLLPQSSNPSARLRLVFWWFSWQLKPPPPPTGFGCRRSVKMARQHVGRLHMVSHRRKRRGAIASRGQSSGKLCPSLRISFMQSPHRLVRHSPHKASPESSPSSNGCCHILYLVRRRWGPVSHFPSFTHRSMDMIKRIDTPSRC